MVTFNALVDTGSSRSYINPKVAKLLDVGSSLVDQVDFDVCTFLGRGTKNMERHVTSLSYLQADI